MVKDAVDAAIDQCSDVFNLRDSIEDSRMRAEQASNDQTRKSHAQKGVYVSRRTISYCRI